MYRVILEAKDDAILCSMSFSRNIEFLVVLVKISVDL